MKEEMQRTSLMPHALILTERKKAEVTGVAQVLSFDENEVALKTEQGDLILQGENMRVTSLLQTEGKVLVEGKFDNVMYKDVRKIRGLFGRK